MNFVIGLARTSKGQDSIWVVINRLTKFAYFLAVKTNFLLDRYAKMYMDELLDCMVHQCLSLLVNIQDLLHSFGLACTGFRYYLKF